MTIEERKELKQLSQRHFNASDRVWDFLHPNELKRMINLQRRRIEELKEVMEFFVDNDTGRYLPPLVLDAMNEGGDS